MWVKPLRTAIDWKIKIKKLREKNCGVLHLHLHASSYS